MAKYKNYLGRKREKDIDLQYVYATFRRLCFERLMTIFVYDNLPFPQRELEFRLYKSGAVAIVQDSEVGTMATWANLNGVTEYLDVFKNVTYAAPTAHGGTVKIGEKAVVCYNDSLHQQLQSHVDIYASLLAHAYMSIKLALINTRYQDILAASDEQTRDNIQAWYRSLYDGKPLAIVHETLVGLDDNIVNLSPSNKTTSIPDLITTYNELWRAFYRDIGIRFTKDKRSNMITDEISSDEQLLLYNVDDMLRQRYTLCEEYNELFVRRKGWQSNEISVRLNPIFDVVSTEKEEVKESEQNENSDT